MKNINIQCQITASCEINPSEDPKKIRRLITNIIPQTEIIDSNDFFKVTSTDIESLSKIQEVIHSRKTQKVYRKTLKRNLVDDTTWFYLNKQAAHVNVVALCENANESPLGPIKVIIKSRDIEQIIGWLVGTSEHMN